MNRDEKLQEIEQTSYWDAQILDFQIKYLGDEVSLFIESYVTEDIGEYCWKISFLRCAHVDYETDAGWVTEQEILWRTEPVKHLRGGQLLGYSGQDIQLIQQEHGLYNCQIVLSNMSINITCQDIEVSKVSIVDQNFFWKKNR